MDGALKIITILSLIATLIIPVLSPDGAMAGEKTQLHVSAAISLKEALETVRTMYAKKEPGVEIRFNLASSGLLQKQIKEGAPVDLFISAGRQQMDELAVQGFLLPETRGDLLGNELVLIVAREKKGSIRAFSDLPGKIQSMSIGQPEAVPAGKYSMETLKNLRLWDSLEKRIIFAKDVRQVLAYVDSGNVDAGLVYRSDTVALKSGFVVTTAPKGSHSPIVYPMAVIRASRQVAAIRKFAAFLTTSEAARVFVSYGFMPLKGKR